MFIGYARVSTADQKLDLQNDALTKAGCERIFADTAGGVGAERVGLEQALGFARKGGTVVVWKLDRLGRSLRHLVETLAALRGRGIGFRSLRESIDTTTSGGKLVFHVFAALAEFERDIIRERTRAGLDAARARGRGAAGLGSWTRRGRPRPARCTTTGRTPSPTSAGRSGSAGPRSTVTSPRAARVPGSFLNDTERERLRRFPPEIPSEDLIGYFTLSERDQLLVRGQRRDHNRLGFALQVCALRYLGFVPAKLHSAPPAAVGHLAEQLGVAPRCLAKYGERSQTRTSHLQEVLVHLGFRKARPGDLSALKTWLVARALEHDRPSLLFQLACEKLRTDKVVRPELTCLERMVIAAQQQAQHETYRLLTPILSDDTKTLLDGLLVPDASRGGTTLTWLRRAAVSNTPKAILRNLEKLEFLKGVGVARWALGGLSPNRLKRLAQIARRATGQALQRMPEERRYPLLVAFLHQSLIDVADETIDQSGI